MSRFRPRLSLFTALLLTTIVGMGIVIAQLWREVGPLREEVRRSRTELGRLTIEDPNKVHVISVRTQENNSWKWRIYLPPGGNYHDFFYSGMMPASKPYRGQAWFDQAKLSGSGMSSTILNGGEFMVEARLYQQEGKWTFAYSSSRSSVNGKMSIDNSFSEWLSGSRGLSMTSNVPSDEQHVYQPGEPILLLKILEPIITEMPGSWSKRSPDGPAEGIAFWIEQDPPQPLP